jgi:hypothetical protein
MGNNQTKKIAPINEPSIIEPSIIEPPIIEPPIIEPPIIEPPKNNTDLIINKKPNEEKIKLSVNNLKTNVIEVKPNNSIKSQNYEKSF